MSNVGFATLQVLPSLKNLQRNLKKEADPVLNAWAKDAGKNIGDTISKAASDGLGDALKDAIGDALDDAGTRGGRSLGEKVEKSTTEGAKAGVRKGVEDGAKEARRGVRAHIGSAMRDGFRVGFREMFIGSQGQGDRMRRSLALGVAGGLIKGAKDGFEALNDAAKNFFQFLADAGRAGGQAAFAAITTAIQGAGTTIATGGLNLIVGALAAIIAAVPLVIAGFLALAPVLYLVGGAAGALFTLAAGGIGTLGVLAFATHGLGKAFQELAQDGKVSDETLKKLSKNARKFVDAVKAAKKPLGVIQKFVQDKFFAGLDKELKNLVAAWKTPLKGMLGSLATNFNGFVKRITSALARPSFIANMKTAFAGFGAFIDRIGKSMGPLIDAFGRLAAGSVPFLKVLGDSLAGVIEKFARWIQEAEKSGALKDFMTEAAQAFKDIWAIGGLVFGIIGDIIEILFPSSKKASNSLLGGVRDTLQKIKDWLGNPVNQAIVRAYIDTIIDAVQEFIRKVQEEWIPKAEEMAGKIGDFIDRVDEWGDKLTTFGTAVSAFCSGVAAALFALASPIAYVTGAFGLLPSGAKKNGDETTGIFRTLRATLIAVFDGMPGRMFGIGAAIGAALAAGLRSQLGEVRGVGRALANAAATAAAAGAQVINPPPGRVTKKSAGSVTRAAPIRASGGGTPSGGPLIGSLTLAPSREAVHDQLEEVNFALRRIRRGGVYA